MEERKYNCPECGTIMNESYDKPALNLTCPKCGYKIATTRWEEIDLDDKKYEIVLVANNNPTLDQIKVVSSITGVNFINSKDNIVSGKSIFKGSPIKVKNVAKILKEKNVDYTISPRFPY